MNNQWFSKVAVWLVIALVLFTVFKQFDRSVAQGNQIGYSDFLEEVRAKRIKAVTLQESPGGGTEIVALTTDDKRLRSTATYLDRGLVGDLIDNGVRFDVKPREEPSLLMSILVSWGPMLLLIGVWIYFMRQMQGGGKGGAFSFGKSKARMLDEANNSTTFADVAGCDEAKEEVKELVDFLKDPQKFQKLGGRIPRGVLLVGPPGTGKTLLAKAIAGEAKVPFFTISGSDFVEMFVGVGAARVRDMFDARRDGRLRDQPRRDRDGGDQPARHPRPGAAAPGPLRPPGLRHAARRARARADSQRAHAQGAGRAGRQARHPRARHARLLGRRPRQPGQRGGAVRRAVMGPERKSMVMPEEERRNTAYHEAGHALVARMLPKTDPVHKVTVIPRGRALGVTMQLPEGDRYSMDKERMLSTISVLFGGRIAEEVFMNQMTTGASNDFERATQLARDMVMRYGMSDELGPMVYAENEGEVFLGRSITKQVNMSEATMQKVDREVRRIIDEQYAAARKLIEDNQDKMHAMAQALLEWETIDSEQIEDIMAGKPPRPPKDWSPSSSRSGGGGAPPVNPDSAPAAA